MRSPNCPDKDTSNTTRTEQDNVPGVLPTPRSGSRQQTDKRLIKERFETAFEQYDRLACVQKEICKTLADELASTGAEGINRAFEFGAGTGFLSQYLFRAYPDARWYVNDLVSDAGKFIRRYAENIDIEWLWGDAETIEYPQGLDLVASACTMQWFCDLAAFAAKAAAATNHGGWLALTTFGKENFREIRATTGEGLDYLTNEELRHIFERAGYRVRLIRDWTRSLVFEDPSSVLRHIKATGVNSVKKARWGQDKFLCFDADYREMFTSPEGGVTLTFNPVIILAQRG